MGNAVACCRPIYLKKKYERLKPSSFGGLTSIVRKNLKVSFFLKVVQLIELKSC